MTKVVPTSMILPDISEFQPGAPVKASTWETFNEAQNYVYARLGAKLQGQVFELPWSSLDFGAGGNLYHTANQTSPGGFYDLDDWQGSFRFLRRFYDTGGAANAYSIQLNTYARNLEVQATLTRFNTEDATTATSTQFTLSNVHPPVASTHQVGTLTFTPDQASRGGLASNGLAYFIVEVEARVPAAATGQLWMWNLRETVITAGSGLPR